jgi:hypothetical protein
VFAEAGDVTFHCFGEPLGVLRRELKLSDGLLEG